MARNQEQADRQVDIGIAYIKSGQYNSAIKELRRADELGKPNPKVHYLLAYSYFYGKGLNELAIGEVKKAIRLDPDYAEAYNLLGVIYNGMENWDAAIEAFEKALSNILYDTPAYPHYHMGWAYYRKGDYGTALKHYELALAQQPDPALLPLIEKNRGIVLYAMGRTSEAILHLQKSLEQAPSLVESRYWLAQCFLAQKNSEQAKSEFQEVIRLAPDTEWGIKSRAKMMELSAGR